MAHAVIVAGGSGVRMGGSRPKQYLLLGDRPILCHTLDAFLNCPSIADIRLVTPESDAGYCRTRILTRIQNRKPIRLVPGGVRRQDSVRNGLADLKERVDRPETVVAIHDGVRPLVRIDDIERCIAEARSCGACILGVPAIDTLKMVDAAGMISGGLPRETVWCAQTPQAFHFETIFRAHQAAMSDGFAGTDDAALVERMGVFVKIIQGSRLNLKITTPEDLALAEAILSSSAFRH